MRGSKPTILYISRYYHPATGAEGIRPTRFVRGLVKDGYRVILITGGEKASLEDSDDLVICRITPSGKIVAEIQVSDAPDWPWWRILPGPDPETKYSRSAYKVSCELIRRYHPDIVFVTGPPFGLAAVAREAADKYNIPMILEYRDAWYAGMAWPYQNGIRRMLARREERRCVEQAKKVITVTDAHKQILGDWYGREIENKSYTVRHGFAKKTTGLASPEPRVNNPDQFTISYIGQLRGIDVASAHPGRRVLQAAGHAVRRVLLGASFCEKLIMEWMSPHFLMQALAALGKEHPNFADKARLIFAGEKYPQIDNWARQYGLTGRVVQRGFLPPEEAEQMVQEADLLVLSLYGIRGMDYHWCVPSKIYTYMGSGKPVIALLPPGEACDLITQAGTGFVIHPEDVAGMQRQIYTLFKQYENKEASVCPDWNFIDQFKVSTQQEKLVKIVASALK